MESVSHLHVPLNVYHHFKSPLKFTTSVSDITSKVTLLIFRFTHWNTVGHESLYPQNEDKMFIYLNFQLWKSLPEFIRNL